MADNIFDNLLAQGIRSGQIPGRSRRAREWFRNVARNTSVTPQKLQEQNKSRMVSKINIGSMYLFSYDPKHKKTLPYYDRFPLVFPFDFYNDGFIGINMHYLDYRLRARLMDALYSTVNNQKYNSTTRLRLNYEVLSQASKFKYFRPTIHRYLGKQVKSRFLEINPAEWDIALHLPIARFSKATERQVWRDSANAV